MDQQNENRQNENQPNENQLNENQLNENQPSKSQLNEKQLNENQSGENQLNEKQLNENQPSENQLNTNQTNNYQQYANQANLDQQFDNRQMGYQWNNSQPYYSQPYYNQPYNEQPCNATQDHKIISQSALGLFIMGLAVILTQIVVTSVAVFIKPDIMQTNWFAWALTAFSMIGIGLPTFYLMSRKIPDSPKVEAVRLKPLTFLGIFLVCTAAMYITNFFSVFITFLIALLKGQSYTDLNPLTEVFTGSNFFLTMLYAAVAAPIVEEFIFRKLLLNKLRRYGDVPAILMCGLAFGLFHMNLAQFFYATALGMIFSYITIRTNTIRYSILLHIMINFIGSAVTPFVTKPNMLVSAIMVTWVFSSIAAGVVIFFLNVRKIRLYRGLPLQKKSRYFLNPGTILYTLMCLVMIVVATLG